MIRQQQDIVTRRKYTEAVRQEHIRLLVAEPNLEPEEIVRKLKLTVRVPKFKIDPSNLEKIVREVVGKAAPSDLMLPQTKKPRLISPDTQTVKDAEINWTFTHQEELPDYSLIGIDSVKAQLEKRLLLIKSGLRRLGVCGMATLITGERGSGKTSLVRDLIKRHSESEEISYLEVSCAHIMACNKPVTVLQNLRDFLSTALNLRPSVVLFDDLDTLLPSKSGNSEKNSETAKRNSAFLFHLQKIWELIRDKELPVWLIGITVSRHSVDNEFLKSSPFAAEEYRIPPLNSDVRKAIISMYLNKEAQEQGCYICEDVDLSGCLNATRGWTPQQLLQLCAMILSEAISDCDTKFVEEKCRIECDGMIGDEKSTDDDASPTICLRIAEKPQPFIPIKQNHLKSALDSAMQCFAPEGFMDIPDVTMEDVGGLDSAKQLVNNYVIQVMQNIELHRSMGFEDSSGILMWGPPGCGKTHLAKAIANACQARFILVKGSELLDKYVGASEQKVKELFERASDNAPCLIFFDEFDALCPARSQDGLHEVSRRVVNSMLIELDGVQKRSGVFVVAATNEPSLIDEAIMRSGRFEHKLYIAPPDEASRKDILQVLCRGKPWKIDSDTKDQIASKTKGFTGADLKFVLNSAAMRSWDKNYNRSVTGELVIDYESLIESMKLITTKNG